jgi:hypothetical protein
MSGKPITKQQVNLYMSYRKDHKQTTAAAQAGMSERTASRIDTGQHSTTKQPRAYRTRKDPLDGAFELHLIPQAYKMPFGAVVACHRHIERIV